MQPKEKTSDLASTVLPATCSGDMYPVVPTTTPSPVRSVCGATVVSSPEAVRSVSFARPKSSTFTKPSFDTMMLPGFRSRWTMPAACALASPSAAWARYPTSVFTSVRPRWMASASVMPSTCSIAMKCTGPAASPAGARQPGAPIASLRTTACLPGNS